MTQGPDRIWAFHRGPMVGLFIGKEEVGSNVSGYIREDLCIHGETLAEVAAVLEEAADDLAVFVQNEWGPHEIHPANQLKFDRDMEVVYRLRAALSKLDPDRAQGKEG